MVDLTFLETFTKGDKKKMKRYVKLYLSIAPDTFKKMEQNILDEDWNQLRINAHSLKPQADYMGIPQLKSVLEEVEKEANNGKKNTLEKLVQIGLNLHLESELFLNNFIINEQ